MSLESYKLEPWKNEHSHRAYRDSAFAVRPAPEFATSEIILSSMYRAVGFGDFSEKRVNDASKSFQKATSQSGAPPSGGVSNDTWHTVITQILASPKQSNQSARRVLQMSPLVPDANLYSGSARPGSSSPWNPGALLKRIISMGSRSPEAARNLWNELFDALSVGNGDDAWARWLQEEFTRRKPQIVETQWARSEWTEDGNNLKNDDHAFMSFPAQQFVSDLSSVLSAKSTMTRRQWLSLVEAVVRLGSVSHVLWLCGTNARIWECALNVLSGSIAVPPTPEAVRDLVFSSTKHHLNYGSSVRPAIINIASAYLSARLGINFLLWTLDPDQTEINSFRSAEDIRLFLQRIHDARERLSAENVLAQIQDLKDNSDNAKTLACKTGIGVNIREFSIYVLGRRKAAESALRGYDQGYVLSKRGAANNSPWLLSLGPVALLALVHCCLRQYRGPRSVRYLSKHLDNYGIAMSVENIGSSEIGKELRMLGLILDSPDAESGILLVPPFEVFVDEGAAR